jgi:hypothetical protein
MYIANSYPHSWWKWQIQMDLVLSAEERQKPVENNGTVKIL